jgi:adenosine deaminase
LLKAAAALACLRMKRMKSGERPAILFLLPILAFASAAPTPPGETASKVARAFAQVRQSPPELYAFLLRMPKGGDLHNHLTGAVYAETLVKAAAAESFCVDERTLAFVRPLPSEPHCGAHQIDAARTRADNTLFNSLVDSLSMRDFVAGHESAHDHFFATFNKFNPLTTQHNEELVPEIVRRAAEQNESYLELMALAGSGPVSALGKKIGLTDDFSQTAEKLRAAGLPEIVAAIRARVDFMEEYRRKTLQCEQRPDSPPCAVAVRYIYQVLREFPPDQVFAQVQAGFLLASTDPRVVAVNFVQPEDGQTSMRDYHLQMRMVDYAHKQYPNVHITLHAGELASGLVPPEGLRYHIREAIELGHAERIGHGVSVMYETDAQGLLSLMKQRHVAVEIALTSNDLILGVSGNNHPFPVYRRHGVPVTLATDDEGVSRSHLTQEYQRAVLSYGLSYLDLKEIVRNSLEHSFLPGRSFWTDGRYRTAVSPCARDRSLASCQSFLASSEKARLQADLEERFRRFEGSF